MSTASKDIGYTVIDSIYDTIATVVYGTAGHKGFTLSGTTYPVYKTVPLDNPAEIYVRIGEVIETEEGTKDDFVYRGSVPLIVCDDSQTNQGDKKKAQSILNYVRGLLKPTKASVPTGFIVFNHEGKNEYIELNDMDKPLVRIVDTYFFIIE